MSTTYGARIGVGFVFTKDEFLSSLKKHKEEVAHFEDRFDPKTGKKQLPAKVVDSEAGEYVVYDGEDYGKEDHIDMYELTEIIGGDLGACCHCFGYEHDFVAVEPSFDELTDSDSYGNFDVGGDVGLNTPEELRPELTRIAKALKKLGIHQGRIDQPLVPRIFINWDIG